MADLSVIAHAGLALIDPLDPEVVDDAVPNAEFPPAEDALAHAAVSVSSAGEVTPELVEEAAARRG